MEKKEQKRRITSKLGKAMHTAIKVDYERLIEQIRKFDNAEDILVKAENVDDYEKVKGYEQAVVKTALGIVQEMANVLACYDESVEWNEWYVLNKEEMNLQRISI